MLHAPCSSLNQRQMKIHRVQIAHASLAQMGVSLRPQTMRELGVAMPLLRP